MVKNTTQFYHTMVKFIAKEGKIIIQNGENYQQRW